MFVVNVCGGADISFESMHNTDDEEVENDHARSLLFGGSYRELHCAKILSSCLYCRTYSLTVLRSFLIEL